MASSFLVWVWDSKDRKENMPVACFQAVGESLSLRMFS